jgi:putative ABC transport system substrate-binding protein
VLWNPANAAFHEAQVEEAKVVASKSGVLAQFLAARDPSEFDAVGTAIRNDDLRALLVFVDPLFIVNRDKLIQLLGSQRILAISGNREFAEAGGLMSYAPSYVDLGRRAATYLDKVLKGANPGDLPIEQPTKFELTINLKTAKAMGIAVPQSILVRADEVIE